MDNPKQTEFWQQPTEAELKVKKLKNTASKLKKPIDVFLRQRGFCPHAQNVKNPSTPLETKEYKVVCKYGVDGHENICSKESQFTKCFKYQGF